MKFFGAQLLLAFLAITVVANADTGVADPSLRGLKSENGNGNGQGNGNGNGNGNANGQDKEKKKNPFKGKRPVKEQEIKGGKVKKASKEDAGRPLSDLPGSKKISTNDLMDMENLPDTGLFMLDTDYIPDSLEEELDEMELTLEPDGTLLNKDGEPTLLIVQSEMLEVELDEEEGDGDGRRLASPYPLSFVRWSWYWRWDGWYCKDAYVRTSGYSYYRDYWGYLYSTNIYRHYSKACVNGKCITDTEYYNSYSSAYHRVDLGCWWPSVGGYHYANFIDGGFYAWFSHSW